MINYLYLNRPPNRKCFALCPVVAQDANASTVSSDPDVCLKDTMSVADSVYNLQLIREFCESSLQSCCPLAVEDLLYAPPPLHVSAPAPHAW